MPTPNRPLPQNKYSEQYMLNASFDEDFGVNANLMLGYDGAVLRRIKVGTDGSLSVTATIDTTGLATSAKQDTGNTSLSSIDGKIPSLGQALAAGSVPIVLTAAQLSTLTPLSSIAATQSGTWNVGTVATITNVVHVDDNSGSLTIDATALTTADLDTGGGTDTRGVMGIALGKSGGAMVLASGSQTSANSLPVVIASDQVSIPVAATLSAETTKVIGTVNQGTSPWAVSLAAETSKVIGVTRTSDGAGNLLTSNSTTYTAKFGLDTNLLGTLGTAFSTAGKVDVKGADGDVFVRQTSAANLLATVSIAAAQTLATVSTVTNLSQLNGAAISMGVGATGTGVQRVVIANDHGKTIVSKGGSASSSGDNTLVAAGTNRLKIKAFSLTTLSSTAVTCVFQSGASGTELWRVVLQAPSNVSVGANLSVAAPDWLFATASATLLNLNLSGAIAVHWSVSYYDEA